MADPRSDADRMRAVGLFDLQADLPGLLKEVAGFLERHAITRPVRFEHRFDRARGWLADLELTPADFTRVLVGYPMPLKLHHVDDPEAGPALRLSTELRAGTLSTTAGLGSLTGTVTADGLVLRPV